MRFCKEMMPGFWHKDVSVSDFILIALIFPTGEKLGRNCEKESHNLWSNQNLTYFMVNNAKLFAYFLIKKVIENKGLS